MCLIQSAIIEKLMVYYGITLLNISDIEENVMVVAIVEAKHSASVGIAATAVLGFMIVVIILSDIPIFRYQMRTMMCHNVVHK